MRSGHYTNRNSFNNKVLFEYIRHGLLLALITLTSASSLDLAAQVSLGGGISISRFKLTGDPPKPFRYVAKLGPALSINLNIPVKDDVRITIQPGYTFQRSALQWRDKKTDEIRDSITLKNDFIRLPVFLDIISDNGKWHYLGGVDIQITVNSTALRGDDETDLSEIVRDLNPVVVFGFGRRIGIGRSILNIDLKFGQGILNLGTRVNEDGALIRRTKSSSLEIAAVYEIPLKKNPDGDD